MKQKWVLLTLLVSQLSIARGELRFKRLSIEQGLSQSTVETIIQDQTEFIWIGTVRYYIRNIYKKLHVYWQSEAVAKALRKGWI